MRRYRVLGCVISTQPEPHLVQQWKKQQHGGLVYGVHLLGNGLIHPEWSKTGREISVDHTFVLNSAYEEIREQRWHLPRDAGCIDGGESYAQLKAPNRVRDLSNGDSRYRWNGDQRLGSQPVRARV